jgi:hypothetical protein
MSTFIRATIDAHDVEAVQLSHDCSNHDEVTEWCRNVAKRISGYYEKFLYMTILAGPDEPGALGGIHILKPGCWAVLDGGKIEIMTNQMFNMIHEEVVQ